MDTKLRLPLEPGVVRSLAISSRRSLSTAVSLPAPVSVDTLRCCVGTVTNRSSSCVACESSIEVKVAVTGGRGLEAGGMVAFVLRSQDKCSSRLLRVI